MSTIKIGIVEDEAIIADNLSNTLIHLGYDVAEPAASYNEALTMIDNEKPDLLLLDIQLKGKKDGIDLAWKIKETYQLPFIFLTANADAATVQRAKQVSPPAYLVKPFTKDDLYSSIEICLHNSSTHKKEKAETAGAHYVINDALFIKDGHYFHKVKFADILYLESEHVYVQVYTADKKFLVRTSMQQYLENFDEKKFFRIHRSYVVNLDHVQSISADEVLINGIALPIGKTYQEELLSRLRLG
ncbi:LytR/AlgR family response regulator transcription factor [Ferruginibacter sp.]